MKNAFGEDKWSPSQVQLDGQVLSLFSGLEADYSETVARGDSASEWAKEQKAATKAVFSLIERLESDARRQHWIEELDRLGLKAAPKQPKDPLPAPDPKVPPPTNPVEPPTPTAGGL